MTERAYGSAGEARTVRSAARAAATFATMLAIGAVALGCESRVSLGQACVSDRDCQEPYLCRAGRCRVECAEDVPCSGGERCLLVAPGVGGCALAVEDAGMQYETLRVCTRPSDCAPDELCTGDFPPLLCRPPCTAHDQCASGVCDWHHGEMGTQILACSVACLPGTGQGCPVETSCRVVGRDAALIPTGPPTLTHCTGFSAGRGDHCVCYDVTSGADCDRGYTCEHLGLDRRMCLRTCVVGEPCSDTTTCQRSARAIVVDGREYGICPPTVDAPIDCAF